MSLKIIKSGLLDTVQDEGRYGFQHLGINPGGTMDRFSAFLANALLGKKQQAPVIEMHFPAAQILFQKETVICLTGADFKAVLNGEETVLYQPVVVGEGSLLSFQERRRGARCYLSVLAEWQLEPWLNSYSTNLKAAAGGVQGRPLAKGDEVFFNRMHFSLQKKVVPLPWKYQPETDSTNAIAFLSGPEWDWLNTSSQTSFLNSTFRITPSSDRMGYRLQSAPLIKKTAEELLSTGVTFGTIQLLPNGQLIILMADHQTTGGYPRIANVVRADLAKLAQMNPGEEVRFVMTNTEAAENEWVAQQRLLQNLQQTCQLKMENWLQRHAP